MLQLPTASLPRQPHGIGSAGTLASATPRDKGDNSAGEEDPFCTCGYCDSCNAWEAEVSHADDEPEAREVGELDERTRASLLDEFVFLLRREGAAVRGVTERAERSE